MQRKMLTCDGSIHTPYMKGALDISTINSHLRLALIHSKMNKCRQTKHTHTLQIIYARRNGCNRRHKSRLHRITQCYSYICANTHTHTHIHTHTHSEAARAAAGGDIRREHIRKHIRKHIHATHIGANSEEA